MLSSKITLSALIPLLAFTSAALGVPTYTSSSLSLDTINKTNVVPQALQQIQNLTFRPWPELPYRIPLYSRSGIPDLSISYAIPLRRRRPPIDIKAFQGFVEEFRDNLAAEYPDPSYAPRHARQFHFDLESYTKWSIELNEEFLGYRLPIEWGLLALNEISRQLGVHGPANLYFKIREDKLTYTYGFLIVQDFGGPSLESSLADGNTISQTS